MMEPESSVANQVPFVFCGPSPGGSSATRPLWLAPWQGRAAELGVKCCPTGAGLECARAPVSVLSLDVAPSAFFVCELVVGLVI